MGAFKSPLDGLGHADSRVEVSWSRRRSSSSSQLRSPTRLVVSLASVTGQRSPTGTLDTVSQTTVVHNQVDEYDVYIGRAVPEHGVDDSKWGNPFVMANDSDAERERAINAYREWVVAQPELMSSLEELRSKRLGCWCAPKPCHGDVLVELLDRA